MCHFGPQFMWQNACNSVSLWRIVNSIRFPNGMPHLILFSIFLTFQTIGFIRWTLWKDMHVFHWNDVPDRPTDRTIDQIQLKFTAWKYQIYHECIVLHQAIRIRINVIFFRFYALFVLCRKWGASGGDHKTKKKRTKPNQTKRNWWSQKKVKQPILLHRFCASHTLCVSLHWYIRTHIRCERALNDFSYQRIAIT